MDRFFTQKYCDRCGGSLGNVRIMSIYNTDCLCIKCKDAETQREDYKTAVEAENKAIQQGNYNFKGIAFKR